LLALTITKEAKEYADSWKNCGVDDIADSIALDLNKLHLVRHYLIDPTKLRMQLDPIPDIRCIFVTRFLNRKLLSYIANACTQ
jgi:hypothetical protein